MVILYKKKYFCVTIMYETHCEIEQWFDNRESLIMIFVTKTYNWDFVIFLYFIKKSFCLYSLDG